MATLTPSRSGNTDAIINIPPRVSQAFLFIFTFYHFSLQFTASKHLYLLYTVGGITGTMAVVEDTDWDINTYRQAHESDEHWQLKEEFMEAHKSILPEDRLVCLAQVYQNVELLGCRYSDEIMEQVAELGRDINSGYREGKKNKLQRTFVKASDAAESRAKGKKTTRYTSELSVNKPRRGKRNATQRDNNNTNNDNNSNGDENSNGDNNSNGDENSNGDDGNGDENPGRKLNAKIQFVKPDLPKPNPNPAISQILQGTTTTTLPSSNTPRLPGGDRYALTEPTNEYRESQHPLSKMIIVQRDYIQEPAIGVLRCSASLSAVPLKLEWNAAQRMGSAWVNKFLVATAKGSTKKGTMKTVAIKTLEELIKHCYTIRVLKRRESDDCVTMDEVSNEEETYNINMNNNECEIIYEGESSSTSNNNNNNNSNNNMLTKKKKKQKGTSLDTPIDDNSLGNKLLRMMGWTGGGLGKEGKGITEPIRPVQIFGRDGLGHEGRTKSNNNNNTNTTATGVVPGRGMYGGVGGGGAGVGGGAIIPGRGGVGVGVVGGPGIATGFPTTTTIHFQKKIKAVIQEFNKNPFAEDISFSSEFTSDQRKMIHQLAQKSKLKSRSYGQAPNRYLVVSKKFSPKQLLQTLLRNGPTDKYEVVPPTTVYGE
ncbi:hypothetical protein Pmani_019535 [Petrolisthes manimaculis]|uniref:NF-kappa-B-repressing factor n=1 Tax=Petrolisthes manimaculis TaxID=1843537 RepID=A0AAE1U3F5_9EUCA|nr:hypothetical protein Pmani_019535 [Petrolisthes manimaculis]